MNPSFLRAILVFYCSFNLCACSIHQYSSGNKPEATINSLRFINEYEIPYAYSFNNTTVGGLSGIDFDFKKNKYFLLSDDRGYIQPARFYTADIFISLKGIDSVLFTSVKNILQPDGSVYPNSKTDPYHTVDPEAIRYNPKKNLLIWSSEGERSIKKGDTILTNPFIGMIHADGKQFDTVAIPENIRMQKIEKGPRQNSVFEGISFADNFKTLYVSMEEPLFEDGPRADSNDNNSFIRILKFDLKKKKNISQFAYKLDPVAHPAIPETGFKINGVSEILYVGNDQLLVMERSFSSGRLACTIKLFLVDMTDASDIKNNPSLKENRDFTAVNKKLLLNMDELGFYIDNIEGLTFGPLLPNGHKTLLFIADNNFSPTQKSQLLLFEIIE